MHQVRNINVKAIGGPGSKKQVEFIWKSFSIRSHRCLQNVKIQFLARDICVWVRPGMTEIALFPMYFLYSASDTIFNTLEAFNLSNFTSVLLNKSIFQVKTSLDSFFYIQTLWRGIFDRAIKSEHLYFLLSSFYTIFNTLEASNLWNFTSVLSNKSIFQVKTSLDSFFLHSDTLALHIWPRH